MPYAWKQLQVGVGKQACCIFCVVGWDSGVSVAMPQTDRTLNGGVVQS